MDKLVEDTRRLDDVGLHHVIAALNRLSNDAINVSQGTVCGHSYAPLREWAALSFTALIKGVLKGVDDAHVSEEQRQQMVLAPLAALSTAAIQDVRKGQIEYLMSILQSHGAQLKPTQWSTVIGILAQIVDKEQGLTSSLVNQSYTMLRLIATDFVQALPIDCVRALVEVNALYGRQQADQNIALSALTQLWTISDFVFRRVQQMGIDAAEQIWLVLYTCLSDLCVDPRPAVRKSACQTLLQTVAAHGHALRVPTWHHMIWKILMPMLDKVKTMTRNASKEREESALLVHHSRDTQSKQWTETTIQTLQGAVKIFNAERTVLLKLDDFGTAWERLLAYVEWGADEEYPVCSELSLACLKCAHELLLGRVGTQTLDINTTTAATHPKNSNVPDRPSTSSGSSSAAFTSNATADEVPPLTPQLWLSSWQSWMRLAHSLVRHREPPLRVDRDTTPVNSSRTTIHRSVQVYQPGPSHRTTLLHIFPPLFHRVKRAGLPSDELRYARVPALIEALVCSPVSADQSPFVVASTSTQLTPTQEAALGCVRSIYGEVSDPASPLRSALPDLIRLLLAFGRLAVRTPTVAETRQHRDYAEWARTQVVPFAECSLRMASEFCISTATAHECVQSLTVVDVVKCLSEPMQLKYECLTSSTWKLAAALFLNVARAALAIAKQRVEHFAPLWPAIAETIENFIFTKNVNVRLSPDERQRDEFIDCQFIDLLRTDVLPYTAILPTDFITRIIHILNRGSISQLDSNDVLASDSFAQRADLSRACFDALLGMTKENASGNSPSVRSSGLGNVAVASLLNRRCKSVMSSFAEEARSGGELRLPRARIVETVAALRAVDALIDRLAMRSDASSSELYSQLVLLHPSIVDLIPSSHIDKEVEESLMTTLKAYQTLMLLKSLPAAHA